MKRWQSTLWYIVILVWPGKHAKSEHATGNNTREAIKDTQTFPTTDSYVDISLVPLFKTRRSSFKTNKQNLNRSVVRESDPSDIYESKSVEKEYVFTDESLLGTYEDLQEEDVDHPPGQYPVIHAGVPRALAVFPVPLPDTEHELAFNITWEPPMGPPVRSYSVEVHSMRDTADCRSDMCYEYNIPGDSTWKLVPEFASPIAQGCSVRPGCAYRVRLLPHPWDGHTSANLDVELDECVAGVCSCAHARRLPTPTVSARAVFVSGDLYVNVSWSLPVPAEPLRLPPRLMKRYYLVSLGKQMVSNIHPAPWFVNSVSRRVEATGFVVVPDDHLSLLIPVVERSVERQSGEEGNRSGEKSKPGIVLDLKLLARVSLIDERGCVGPPGNTVAYDPAKNSKTSLGSYVLWAVFGGTVVLATVVLLAVGSRAVKRVLKALRVPSATLQPLSLRPAWFPTQLHSTGKRADDPPDGKWLSSPMDTSNTKGITDALLARK